MSGTTRPDPTVRGRLHEGRWRQVDDGLVTRLVLRHERVSTRAKFCQGVEMSGPDDVTHWQYRLANIGAFNTAERMVLVFAAPSRKLCGLSRPGAMTVDRRQRRTPGRPAELPP